MLLTGISPGGKSIKYVCEFCKKAQYAVATDARASMMLEKYHQLVGLLHKFNHKLLLGCYSNGKIDLHKLDIQAIVQDYDITDLLKAMEDSIVRFKAPESPLPFEQTRREPIPEAVRHEVWRRDCGKCGQCGSAENLQFDHIIPVSRGGATTTANLQLLCLTCNVRKSNNI